MAHSEGSFVRWQATTIAQLGYAVNLFLTFATASLGFAFTLAKDKGYAPGCWAKCFWSFSVLLVMASASVGAWCVINRLRAFRNTAQVARRREKLERDQWAPKLTQEEKTEINKQLECFRSKADSLDRRTWPLFCWQIGTFGVAALLLVAAFVVAYHGKLF
jgi:hypothetical protein